MEEHEFKVLLSKREYNYLVSAMGMPYKQIVHTNYYYDTADLSMNKANITYRIRENRGICTATVKYHIDTCRSIEKSFSARNKGDCSAFPPHLMYQGRLITERKVYNILPGITVCFDKNTYLGTVDYELEIEYSPEKKQEAEDLLIIFANKLHDRWIIDDAMLFYLRGKYTKNKSSRFFEQKVRMIKEGKL